MVHSILSLVSPLLGVLLVGGLGALIASRLRTSRFMMEASATDAPEPANPKGLLDLLALSLSLVLILTLNQFFGLLSFLPALLLLVLVGWLTIRPEVSSSGLISSFIGILGVGIIVAIAFAIHGRWLVEGPNHDLILYVRGGDWALQNGTLAPGQDITQAFASGRETASCFAWIGDACPLHRGGTHTLVGLESLLGRHVIPTQAFLFILPLVLLIRSSLSLNVRELPNFSESIGVGVLASLLSASAPILGALWNGNLATAAGALVLLTATLTFVSPAARRFPATTAVTLGVLTGLAAHVYSEAMWICGLITAAHGILASLSAKPVAMIGRLLKFGLLSIGAWLLAGNSAVLMAITAIFTLSGEVGREYYWANYFLEVENWRWLSIPYAGSLFGLDDQYPSQIGAFGTVVVIALAMVTRNRLRFAIPVLIVAAAVISLEVSSYYYGVHKVVQLLGPLIAGIGIAAILQLRPIQPATIRGGALALGALLVLGVQAHSDYNFSNRTRMAVAAFVDKEIALADASLFEPLTQGSTILLNDLSWSPGDRFSKTNWINFLVQREESQLVMGATGGDPFRGAYSSQDLPDTLRWTDEIDWVAQASDRPGMSLLVHYDGAPTFDAGRIELVDLRDHRLPAVFLGTGFYEREPDHVWTQDHFTLEVICADSCMNAASGNTGTVELSIASFAPPTDATIRIQRDGVLLGEYPATATAIRLPLAEGHQTLDISASWPIQSPADIGLNEDNRKLFIMLKSVTSKPG